MANQDIERDPEDIEKIKHQYIEIETQRDFLEWIFNNLINTHTLQEAFELFNNQPAI